MDEQLHDISTLNHGAEWTDMEAYLHEGTVILGCDNDYRRKKASYIFSHLQVSNFQNTLSMQTRIHYWSNLNSHYPFHEDALRYTKDRFSIKKVQTHSKVNWDQNLKQHSAYTYLIV